jgi:hypothetical protein
LLLELKLAFERTEDSLVCIVACGTLYTLPPAKVLSASSGSLKCFLERLLIS